MVLLVFMSAEGYHYAEDTQGSAFLETFPSSQPIAVTRACILEERSSVERETVV